MKTSANNTNDTGTQLTWNDELVVKLIPVYAVLLLYLMLGVSGNSVVLFIYLRKFNSYSEGRYFIPVLAVTDMLSCVVSCCGHMSETMVTVIYKIDIACKLERYLRMITTAFAMFTLVLIVIDRYLKICRPFGWQMTKTWKRVFVGVVIIAGFVVSAPCFIFYGSAAKSLEDGTIIGWRCSGVSGGYPDLALAFNISLFSIAFAELVLMSVLYFLICKVIFKKSKFRQQHQMTVAENSEAPPISDTHFEENPSLDIASDSNSDKRKGTSTKHISFKKFKAANREATNSRITRVFLVITIAFGISFIPTIAMMVLESTNVNFWFTLSDQEYVGIMFLYTFYIFNNFINPFIYGFMDEKFRFELKQLCCIRNSSMYENKCQS